MPGGRLGEQDRRLIASRLAAGHGYAEIARELDRPTSTISREVTRNGGRTGYRAEHAHLATSSRARRRKRSTPEDAAPATDAYGRDRAAVHEFAEHFAGTMIETGLQPMAARVLSRLYTADSPSLTAAELVRELKVSPASISKAINYLEGLELVRREPVPGERHEHYLIAEDFWIQAWRTSARANANWAGAGPDPETAEDVTTVLAALVHAARPLTADQLATALEWSADRVATALATAEEYKIFTDPLAVELVAADTYRITTPRLTEAQRRALQA
jgi:DNA-binding transcriptional regulator GbsR (MarR family)